MSESRKPNFPGFSIERRNGKILVETAVHLLKFGSKNKAFSISGIPGELFEDIAEEFYENSSIGRENTFKIQMIGLHIYSL